MIIPKIVRKFLFLLFSLWAVATLTFLLMHAIPGDPFISDQALPEEVLRSLYAHYGLDRPLLVQYGNYLWDLLHGNLGISITYAGRGVAELIQEAFPVSARVGLQALVLAIPCGTAIGLFSALRQGSLQDRGLMLFSSIGLSLPNFVIAALLQYLFAIQLPFFPIARWGGIEHTILPTLTLSLPPIAFIARLTRANAVESLRENYIKLAFAKGLSLTRIALRHLLPNAFLPVISYLGPITAQILMGSFMVERIFALPGLGQWMIHSIHTRDYPTILGLAFFFSALLLTATCIVDLLLSLIDPRIRSRWRVHES
ncbi:MAG: ABC transporter permease [Verrucomicrobiota bacterium]|nr:ABC transporter permease [Verrucomicrobiota bacterium]